MLQAFARFVEALFPSLDSKNAKEYLNTFWRDGPVFSDFYASVLPPKICQGDIVGPITFIVQMDSGDLFELVLPGMVLSHSCDIDRDEEILFAACIPAKELQKRPALSDIQRNTAFGLIYLAAVPRLGDTVVDLGRVQSVRRKFLEEGLRTGVVRRFMSLTQLGYYFLIAKLTVRFLRPQADDEVRYPAKPPFWQRVRDVLRACQGLLGYLLRGREY